MASDVRLAASAEADRDRIAEYLLRDLGNRQAAARFFDQLDLVIDRLEEFPLAYPAYAEPRLAAMGYRKASFPEMAYLALYRVVDGIPVVARIFHARQDYARLL